MSNNNNNNNNNASNASKEIFNKLDKILNKQENHSVDIGQIKITTDNLHRDHEEIKAKYNNLNTTVNNIENSLIEIKTENKIAKESKALLNKKIMWGIGTVVTALTTIVGVIYGT